VADQRKSTRPDRTLPILLIALGFLILLVNSGLISWRSLLGLLQLWPLVLVAIGLDLLLRGRYRLYIVAATVAVGVLFSTGVMTLPGAAPAQAHQISQSLAGAQRAEVLLRGGVGELRVTSLTGSSALVEGTVRTGQGERLLESFSSSAGVARYSLGSEQRGGSFITVGRGSSWELGLNAAIPLTLSIQTGVGRSLLELSDLQLARLALTSGVGATTITLPRQGDYEVIINAGVGATTVRIPAGVAARLEIYRGLGGVSVRGDLEQRGNVYESPGYATATDRATVRIRGGLGAISVEADS
jgi:hypothetical protein